MGYQIRKYACAVFSGVTLFLAFPATHCYPLAWVALIPLFFFSMRLSFGQAAVQFGIAGWVFHSLLLQWLITNIFWAGGWAVIGYQLLCIGLALFWGGIGALWRCGYKYTPAYLRILLLPLLWAGMEWLQAHLFTGFGWSALGYSQGPDILFAQCAALGGVSFLSFVLVLFSALVGTALAESKGRWIRLGMAAGIAGAAHGIGIVLLDDPEYPTPPLNVGIFQSNFSQEMKYDREYTLEMVNRASEHSRRLLRERPVDCFLWPEALIMADYERQDLLEPIQALARDGQLFLFAGATRTDRVTGREYNSSVLINPQGTVGGYYDKVHLAPFGEFMPFTSIFPFLRQIVPMDVDAGVEQKVFPVRDRRLGPLICFEVLFDSMAESLRRQGADFLVVLTNLGWFGSSNATAQELEIARFRAIETRLPLAHCSNTGISGVFDPWGRFSPSDIYPTPAGQLFKWDQIHVQPSLGVMQRLLGVSPISLPGNQPSPIPIGSFSMVAGCVAIAAYGILGLRYLLKKWSNIDG